MRTLSRYDVSLISSDPHTELKRLYLYLSWRDLLRLLIGQKVLVVEIVIEKVKK